MGTSSSLSDDIASAVVTALGNSLPTIIVAIRDNSTPVSSASPAILSVSSSAAMVVAGSYAASSGTLRLPSSFSTFPPVPAISGSNLACLVDSFSSPVMSAHANISSGLGSSFMPPSLEKAFVVGPGHAPIPAWSLKLPVVSLLTWWTYCWPTFVQWIRNAYLFGRRNFGYSSVSLHSASANMYSALVHPVVIDDYLETEVSCGRVAGPFTTLPFPDLHISRFGVIPKNNQPG